MKYKQITFLLASCLFIALNPALAQQGTLFQMKQLPRHNYDIKANTAVTFYVNLSKGDTLNTKIKGQDNIQPVSGKIITKRTGQITTGQLTTNGRFPATIVISIDSSEFKISGKDLKIPGDKATGVTHIYGQMYPDGKFKADAVSGNTKDTSEKNITKMMHTVVYEIPFPKHHLKIGDSFTQELPLDIPIADNGTAVIKSTYKLLRISGEVATFNIAQAMDTRITVKQLALHLTGTGSGTLVFNLKNNYPSAYKSNLNLIVSGKVKNRLITGKGAFNIDNSYKVK